MKTFVLLLIILWAFLKAKAFRTSNHENIISPTPLLGLFSYIALVLFFCFFNPSDIPFVSAWIYYSIYQML